MSRRRSTKKSNAEFLMELMARLPWWAGRSLPAFGHYLLPLICLAGAAMSAWRRRERRQLMAEVAETPTNRGAETTLVQCKQWRAFKVGVDVC